MSLKRNALGRGLDSLISMDDVPARGTSAINEISIDLITPNPDQPRTSFDNDSLDELATSIRELGIIQPLSLRRTGPDTYQIIAGERRFRAARLAGLTTVPAYIREANDMEVTEMALIENIQREDLNAIEIALTFKKLLDQYDLTQERLSERIGRKRATIANFLRLLKLPAEVQLGLRDRRVDMGHARALLSLDNPTLQLRLYNRIIHEGLSVRKVEETARKWNENPPTDSADKKAADKKSRDFEILEKHLSQRFNAPVGVKYDNRGGGQIAFKFRNVDELEKLIAIFDALG
ncbi:MAG: ParB/RepB/Spo0J family partition protein [Muribaculaceae bacterium]|nr:ParB/RepB/Spo0J family partition protein [Muribaculaceae bacterium]MCF0214075.1 ParB/RepB/Spo0J family partition protein [Muribaculaceae bacterium]MCF0214530.1 ParB/RepB/Spo0J family partition protein [Muribaculaceae bacterium]